jgi:hypothetical protein
MPKKLVSEADILKAWEKKRERDKKAQATWVAKNKEIHLQRMREQYVKKAPTSKEYKPRTKNILNLGGQSAKEKANADMMAKEDRDAPTLPKPKRKLRTPKEKANAVMMAMEDRDAPKNKRKLKK